MKGVEIMHATPSQKEALIELLLAEKLPTQDLPGRLDNFFVAVADKAIVGMAGLEVYACYGLLRSVVVAPAFRNGGLAAKLVKAVEEEAAAANLQSVYLLTETARSYFERKGYGAANRATVPDEIRASPEFSHVCPVSATVMVKKLDTYSTQ